jgi:hypothetical protein
VPRIDLTLIGLHGGSRITDDDASALFSAWTDSPPGGDLVVAGEVGHKLKTKGLVKTRGGRFALTPEGRKIIVEMVTNCPNKFNVTEEMPSYRQIKARAKRRPLQSLVKKASLEPKTAMSAAEADAIENVTIELRSVLEKHKARNPQLGEELTQFLDDVEDLVEFDLGTLDPLTNIPEFEQEPYQPTRDLVKQREEWYRQSLSNPGVIVRIAGF